MRNTLLVLSMLGNAAIWFGAGAAYGRKVGRAAQFQEDQQDMVTAALGEERALAGEEIMATHCKQAIDSCTIRLTNCEGYR